MDGVAPAAWASCVPNPPASPSVFTGTVTSTERDGLVAHVGTDDGRMVTVVGTPADSGVTTVDRTYQVGARYEFHPLNATDPFQDNICTRTHIIGPAGVPTTTEAPGSTRPPLSISDTSPGGVSVGLVAGTGAAAVLVLGSAVAIARRRRNAR